jgi:hypothetical protein
VSACGARRVLTIKAAHLAWMTPRIPHPGLSKQRPPGELHFSVAVSDVSVDIYKRCKDGCALWPHDVVFPSILEGESESPGTRRVGESPPVGLEL